MPNPVFAELVINHLEFPGSKVVQEKTTTLMITKREAIKLNKVLAQMIFMQDLKDHGEKE